MRAVELFAGAGGAALGLHAASVEHLRCIEWDKDAAATLAAAGFPAVCGDVRDLSLYAGLDPDLVWSSFPCQCWSSAGKRLGTEDERNGWPWTVDAIDAMRPRWFVAENVTGLTQHRGECASGCAGPELCPRAYLDRVILEQLRERFPWVACRVLNASSYGVPQHRRRLIIVAGPRPIDWPAPTHGKPTGQGDLFGRKLLPWRTVRDALGIDADVIQSGVAFKPNKRTKEQTTEGPSPTITTEDNMYVGESIGRPLGAGSGVRVIGGGTRGHGMAEWRPRDCTDEPGPCVNAMQGSTAGIYVEYRRGRDGGARYERHGVDEPSCALRGSPGGSSQPFLSGNATERRRLTVQECAILQDFPPDHPWQGNKQSQYRQVGNAVPPTLARVVVEAVIKADKGQA